MKDDSNLDNAGVKLPPPFVFIGLGMLAIGIDTIFPLKIGIISELTYLGIALIVATLVLVRYISRIFYREGTNIAPWATTHRIVTYGPYKYSRNPIYVAACGIPIALGIFFDTYWALLAFIPALAIVYFTAIRKEEKYLERKFGEEYLAYKVRVRRWL